MRTETEIFTDLEAICKKPGYVHVLAYLCFKYNTLQFNEQLTPDDASRQYGHDKLIRTEISTLIGLFAKGDMDVEPLSSHDTEFLIERTESLLAELHQSLNQPMMNKMQEMIQSGNLDANPFSSADVLREPIFYGGESAYNFQYRDLAKFKYQGDDIWLEQNFGFYIGEAKLVATTLSSLQDDKLKACLKSMRGIHPDQWTFLPAFSFELEELATRSNLPLNKIEAIIGFFSKPDEVHYDQFDSLGAFNPTLGYPILELKNGKKLLLQNYTLVEALYDTPFYYMIRDNDYADEAIRNRGRFAEDFCESRLIKVFGAKNVFSNINIVGSKKKIGAEIDILVVYADRAIVVQVKSKKLTLEARRGNDGEIRDDFAKGIQAAYDQATNCTDLLQDDSFRLYRSDGSELKINRDFKQVFLFCVTSEHYPALSMQAAQFLQLKERGAYSHPFVMDVFLLDVMTEMLSTPLYFLSYCDRRATYGPKLHVTHELTTLSYHLRKNLWFENDIDGITFDDEICADLDTAMLVRREGLPGSDTPDGILTKFGDTFLGNMVKKFEAEEHAGIVDLGFTLLYLSEDAITDISEAIEKLAQDTLADGDHHDLTVPIGGGATGLTVHCNFDSEDAAQKRLNSHCEKRKYRSRANSWFGILLHPFDLEVRSVVRSDTPWEFNQALEEKTAKLPKVGRAFGKGPKKIGRNEKCPCGSMKKYKKCCGR